MGVFRRQNGYRWYWFFTLGAILFTLQGCGSVTRGEEEALQISLQVPSGENPEFFWFGVQSKSLRVTTKDGETRDIAWDAGAKSELDLREGDQIEFRGVDQGGLLLVTGQAVVSEEKKITIELRRVL